MIVEIERDPKGLGRENGEVATLVEALLHERASAEIYDDFSGTALEGIVNKIVIDKSDKKIVPSYHYYTLNTDGFGAEFIESDSTCLNAAYVFTLPCKEFDGIWENLHFDSEIKNNLLDYLMKALLFAERGVDHNVISFNKLVLLHGPPGTGKTSLCKGVAQKLAIRWTPRFRTGHFIEINAHSLFSKFFSESGKLVLKMFEKIEEIASDEAALVFILIDEVESLAHSRAAAAAGSEPSDAIRVVNAVLTQLDRLKMLPNALILTTSNVETSIDGAFVDRADLCVYIGHPSPPAISKILASCAKELIKRNLLEDKAFAESSEFANIWTEICRLSVGVSGRSLRKLPLLAFCEGHNPMPMALFLDALFKLVKSKTAEKKLSQTHHMFQSISLV
ncbi:pachytene checkpoint protein 2 homolog isoform X2 [Varroa destructor]|uniref:AAA+ ATPase domain-containing protein n=1 Tax=Varroa destructor TaxID=109461 RepID=A0A7M7K292_VARDE|nr:pachytene checkpoint protein 2 homolog isoform X2 [Varroa destructor]